MSKDTAHYRRAREHALMRARERYGLRLTVRDYRWLCNRLRAQIGVAIGIQEDGAEIWIVFWHMKKPLVVAYRRELNAILTFLPKRSVVDVAASLRRAG